MELVRVTGLLHSDQAIPGQPVSMSQAFALHELDTDTPLSQRELAERLYLEKSTISRMAADMERKGLLRRERDPANRRLYRLRLTDRGRDVHAGIGAAFHDHYLRWAAAMSDAEHRALVTGLPALIRAMRDDLAPWRPGAAP
jgi:DNA-binding MarR family transcriptional regulator